MREDGDGQLARVLLASIKTDMAINLVDWTDKPVKTLIELAIDTVADDLGELPLGLRESRLVTSGLGDGTFGQLVQRVNVALQAYRAEGHS